MIFIRSILICCVVLITVSFNLLAQNEEEMTQESWQKQIDEYTAKRTELYSKIADVDKDIISLKNMQKKTDSVLEQRQNEVYTLIDADKNQVNEFNDRFETTEKKILNESASLSDIKEYWFDWISKNKIRLLSQYRYRYAVMKEKIDNWKGE